MDLLAPVRAFDRFQRRHAPLAIPVAVLRGISDQGAGNASVLIAYWSFFSIFPLLLFSTILGFVLQGHPSVQHSLLHSALEAVERALESANDSGKERAQQWLRSARAGQDDDAVNALAGPVEHALGLAGR